MDPEHPRVGVMLNEYATSTVNYTASASTGGTPSGSGTHPVASGRTPPPQAAAGSSTRKHTPPTPSPPPATRVKLNTPPGP